MAELTRRVFVKTSVGAAASLTALGVLATAEAEAHGGPGTEPMVAFVRDPARGEISLMVGEREINFRDPELVARLAQAAR